MCLYYKKTRYESCPYGKKTRHTRIYNKNIIKINKNTFKTYKKRLQNGGLYGIIYKTSGGPLSHNA
ncbi:MAG TPA: hypothetical protein DHU65_04190 [Clostridiales bacterium]|nr:hypothetical protein [Clostridiales bacterium]